MLISSIIYVIINILLDWYPIKRLWSNVEYKISKIRYGDGSDGEIKSLNNSVDEEHYNTLKAKNLRKMYSGKAIVRNIGFTLKEKECLGILGVNGAGKTTTFRMLTRDEVLNDGNIEIIDSDNKPITINQDEVRIFNFHLFSL